MDKRAAELGRTVGDDAYVFSLEPDCAKPMRPEFMTRRMRDLRKRMGLSAGDLDATILAMRKWTTTELMDAGFNPSMVSGRQGHTVLKITGPGRPSWRSHQPRRTSRSGGNSPPSAPCASRGRPFRGSSFQQARDGHVGP